jgi:hypothetical protein
MAVGPAGRHVPATASALNSGTAARLHKLVMRAMKHRYGAESALRSAVKLGSAEMLEAGASQSAVRHAIAGCVISHPSSLPDRPSLLTGESRVSALLKSMLAWTDDVMTTPTAAVSS